MALQKSRILLPVATLVVGGIVGRWVLPALLPQAPPQSTAVPARATAAIPAIEHGKESGARTASHLTGVGETERANVRMLWENARRGNWRDPATENLWLAFVQECLEADAAQTIALVMSLEGSSSMLGRFVRVLKPQHLRLALDAALKRPDLWEDFDLPGTIFEGYAKVDPRGAWQEATAPGRFLHGAVRAVAAGWASKNPREAMTFAANIGNPVHRDTFAQTVLMEWARKRTGEFLDWYAGLPDRSQWARLIQWQGIAVNSEAEFQRLVSLMPEEMPAHDSQRSGISYAGDHWSSRLDWLQKLPVGPKRDFFMERAAANFASTNPEAALALLSEIRNPSTLRRITSTVAALRAATSPQDGIAFANSLEDENVRRMARLSALNTWGLSDPRAAATWALENADTKNSNDLYSIGRNWAEHDPEGASAFALEAAAKPGAPGGAGTEMLRSVMEKWVSADAYGASLWVTKLPAGAEKDHAIGALARGAIGIDPQAALGWAMSIGDAGARDEALRNCMQSWSWKNPAAARGWLESAALPAPLIQELRKNVDLVTKNSSAGSNTTRWRGGITTIY